MQIILNVNEDPIAERHVAYFSERSKNMTDVFGSDLFEVVERTYRHPGAPEYATLKRMEIKAVEMTPPLRAAAALLYNHQDVCRSLQRTPEQQLFKCKYHRIGRCGSCNATPEGECLDTTCSHFGRKCISCSSTTQEECREYCPEQTMLHFMKMDED